MTIAGVAPDVVLISVLLFAVRSRSEPAIIFAFIAGLVFDALSVTALGLRAGVYATVAFLAIRTIDRMDSNPFSVAAWVALMTLAGVMLYVVVGSIFGQVNMDADDILADLQQAIGDSDESVRLAAALAALQFDPQLPAAQEPVLAAIRARNPQLILAVGELGPAVSWATPAVRELLSDRESQIRELAKATMARIQRPAR